MEADTSLTRLRHALQALALPAERQLPLLPGFVQEVDDLVLSFEHWLGIVQADKGVRLTKTQRQALAAVERLLDEMSGQRNAHLWTRASLKDGEPWVLLRQAAHQALAAFGWDLDTPPGRLFEYIEW